MALTKQFVEKGDRDLISVYIGCAIDALKHHGCETIGLKSQIQRDPCNMCKRPLELYGFILFPMVVFYRLASSLHNPLKGLPSLSTPLSFPSTLPGPILPLQSLSIGKNILVQADQLRLYQIVHIATCPAYELVIGINRESQFRIKTVESAHIRYNSVILQLPSIYHRP